MKKVKFLGKAFTFSLMSLFALTLSINQAQAQSNYDPSGVWVYEVSTPEGNLSGEMTIEKTAKGYDVTIKSDVYGTIELEDVVFEKMILEGYADVNGDTIEFEWEFEGDELTGLVYTPDGELEMSAEKKKS